MVLDQPRSTQRQEHRVSQEQRLLTVRITELACEYGRYGYRRITALLRSEDPFVGRQGSPLFAVLEPCR